MMSKTRLLLTACLMATTVFAGEASWAVRTPKPLASDHRLQTVVYSPYEVYKFTGHYGYQSSILFSEGEVIRTISMGDSVSWMINPVGNRLFLKPLEPDAITNMTLITSKRTYYFELHPSETENINDKGMVFEMRFVYEDEGMSGYGGVSGEYLDPIPLPDIEENAEKYNFNYTIAGPDYIAPLRIFDDGEFTYFEFKDKNADVPAFFVVDKDGEESVINFRTRGDYIVVERVASRFTLRHGKDALCVFNEARPFTDVKKGKVDK